MIIYRKKKEWKKRHKDACEGIKGGVRECLFCSGTWESESTAWVVSSCESGNKHVTACATSKY